VSLSFKSCFLVENDYLFEEQNISFCYIVILCGMCFLVTILHKQKSNIVPSFTNDKRSVGPLRHPV